MKTSIAVLIVAFALIQGIAGAKAITTTSDIVSAHKVAIEAVGN